MVKNIIRCITCSLVMVLPTASYAMIARLPAAGGRMGGRVGTLAKQAPHQVLTAEQQKAIQQARQSGQQPSFLQPPPGELPAPFGTTQPFFVPGTRIQTTPGSAPPSEGAAVVRESDRKALAEKERWATAGLVRKDPAPLLANLLKTNHVGNNIIKQLMGDGLIFSLTLEPDIEIAKKAGLQFGFIHPYATETINYLKKTAKMDPLPNLQWLPIISHGKTIAEMIQLPDNSMIALVPSQNNFEPFLIKPDNAPRGIFSYFNNIVDLSGNVVKLAQDQNKVITNIENQLTKIEQEAQELAEAQQKALAEQQAAEKALAEIKAKEEAIKAEQAQLNAEKLKTEIQGLQEKSDYYAELINKEKDFFELSPEKIKKREDLLSLLNQGKIETIKEAEVLNKFFEIIEKNVKRKEAQEKAVQEMEAQRQEDYLSEQVDIEYKEFEKELESIETKEKELADTTKELETVKHETQEIQQQHEASLSRLAQEETQIKADADAELAEIENQYKQQRLKRAEEEANRSQAFLQLNKAEQEKVIQQIKEGLEQELEAKRKSIENERNLKLKENKEAAAKELKEIQDLEAEHAKLEQEIVEAEAQHELAKQQRAQETKAESEAAEKAIREEAAEELRLEQEKYNKKLLEAKEAAEQEVAELKNLEAQREQVQEDIKLIKQKILNEQLQAKTEQKKRQELPDIGGDVPLLGAKKESLRQTGDTTPLIEIPSATIPPTEIPEFPSPDVQKSPPETIQTVPLDEEITQPTPQQQRAVKDITTKEEPRYKRKRATQPSLQEQKTKELTPITPTTYDLTKPPSFAFPKAEIAKPFTPHIRGARYTPPAPSTRSAAAPGGSYRYSGEPYYSGEEFMPYQPTEIKHISPSLAKKAKARQTALELLEAQWKKTKNGAINAAPVRPSIKNKRLEAYSQAIRTLRKKATMKKAQIAQKTPKKAPKKEATGPVWSFITNIQTTITDAITNVIEYFTKWFS